MLTHFELTLVVTHACNLRCTYCYTGEKLGRVMPVALGQKAIDRALSSLEPGGTLDLGFFGGEPLLAANRVLDWMSYARQRAPSAGQVVRFSITTNATINAPQAWQVMLDPDVALSVSHDGLPEIHDDHRVGLRGATSSQVEATLTRLLRAGKDVNVVMVVRPTTLDQLSAGLKYLHALGIRQITPSLDLWAAWASEDGVRLQAALAGAADIWATIEPHLQLSWFEEQAAGILGVPRTLSMRCAFGHGQVAVAPSGRMYPCERLVGEDRGDHPLRLPGNVRDGGDFFFQVPQQRIRLAVCRECVLESQCSTHCRCSNYLRTGDVDRPDGLLCLLDRVCHRETVRAIREHPERFFLSAPAICP